MAILHSDRVLEGTPGRVTKLLMAIGAVADIRAAMAQAGMTDADIAEGGALLLACLIPAAQGAAPADTDDARAQRAAAAELDRWDEPNLARYGAALRRGFPDAHDYVFRDLAPAKGPGATLAVATFLQRIDTLDAGSDPARAAHRAGDRQAVALLARRGLDAAERGRLQALVDRALGPTAPLPQAPGTPGDDDTAARRRAAQVSLKGWYDDWAATARAVIRKRGHLIRMGLASRRRPRAAAAAAPRVAAHQPDAAPRAAAHPADAAPARQRAGTTA